MDHDALVPEAVVDSLAQRADDSGAVGSRDVGQPKPGSRNSAADEDVEVVDSGRAHLDENFAGSGRRVRHRFQSKDRRRTVLVKTDGLHPA